MIRPRGRIGLPRQVGNYAALLAVLLSLPLLQALAEGNPTLEQGYWLAFFGMLAVAMASVGHTRHALWMSVILGGPSALAMLCVPVTGFNLDTQMAFAVEARTAINLAFLGCLSVMILRDIGDSRRVMLDQICGALCVYLMIGLAWGLMFTCLERLNPGAFAIDLKRFGLHDSATPLRLNAVMTYSSIVTLTTLGYGDVSPVSPLARALVSIEAVLGQFYMAVFVARLVSQYLSPATPAAPTGPVLPSSVPHAHLSRERLRSRHDRPVPS